MSILVDTSVWVQYFRRGEHDLQILISNGEVVSHPVVVGELAVGGMRNRTQSLTDLRDLSTVPESNADDTLDFIENHRLYGIGLSWGDAQLLASAVANAVPIWTFDTTLRDRARAFGLEWTP